VQGCHRAVKSPHDIRVLDQHLEDPFMSLRPPLRAAGPEQARQHRRVVALAGAGLAVALLWPAAPAQAALVTDPIRILTFDDAAGYDLASSRVQIGASVGADVGVSAAHGALHFGAPLGAWSLGSNGEWTSAKTFVGIEGGGHPATGHFPTLVFDFGGKAVRSVRAQVNFVPDIVYGGGLPLPLSIAAFDRSGRLIESHELPVFTPAKVDAGPFFGIELTTPRIARFEVSGPYAVVDDFTFSAPVPEPGTVALLIAGLAAVGLVARRRAR
jgi:hypothetical protein